MRPARPVSPREAEWRAGLALEALAIAWERYATAYQARFDSSIGEDHVLGPAWHAVGNGIRDLLNGPSGTLDCGHMERFVRTVMERHGCNPDE